MFIKKLTSQVICNPDEPLVQTPNGKLRGLIVDGTYIFRGVKYADAKRFHMPTPVEPWEGVKDAIIYGPVCPEIQTVLPHDNYNVPHVFYPQHEDCQYLNIWTQDPYSDKKKPVMVWLHGGGFATGSGIEHFAYDGENLSRYGDVVVVTLNHRLNVLGYLDLSAYGEEYKYSGNVGMADIVEALRWIRDNIACFGGDPNNVMIFGQSGGGGKVATLLQTPAADGLYHRAAIQSGLFIGSAPNTPEDARKAAAALMAELGIDDVAELETIKYHKLARAVQRVQQKARETGIRLSLGPVVDGDYYKGSPMDIGFSEYSKNIPLLVGSVFAEFSTNFNVEIGDGRKNDWTDEETMIHLKEKFGESAEAVAAAFREAYPNKHLADVWFIDTGMRAASKYLADIRVREGGAPYYNYLFTLESDILDGTMAWHNAEIPYIFHNAYYIEPSYTPGVTEALQEIVCGAWASFAWNGDPNHVGMRNWPAYTEDCHATMIFDEDAYVGVGHDEKLLATMPTASRVMMMNQRSRRMVAKLFGGGPRI